MFNIWQWLKERQARQVVKLIRRADSSPELAIHWGADSIQLVQERDVGAAPPGLFFFHAIHEIHYISKNVVALAAGIMRREDFKGGQGNDPTN